MKRKFRYLAFLMVIFLLLPAVPIKAGEQLGETDFESGKGLPWHIVESNTGEMDFEIKDGKYVITIINPGGASNGGEDRWDCQFRHRGLTIVAGHQYRVRYEITPSNSGKYYTKIGNMKGDVELWHNMSNGYDLDATWDPISIGAGETKKVDLTFTANQSMEVAEWAFHLGGDGQYTQGGCFPAGTVITFDNMSLIDLSSDENDYHEPETPERHAIMVNQLGYFTGAAKKATMLADGTKGISFEVLNDKGETVFEGESVPMGDDMDSQDTVHLLDFTGFDDKGTFRLRAEGDRESCEFTIGDSKAYSALLYDSLNYFYQNRSGIAIDKQYITSGDASGLARAAGHASDNATIEGSGQKQDVTGGWYDAGDHGKYVVNGGISVWLLQNQYEVSLRTGTSVAYVDGTMSIPENNNGCPDILDEARWELEWMLTMLVKDGENKDMVYHKVHDAKWTGLGIAPAEDTEERVIKAPSTAATLNVAACAAQGARLWKDYDEGFAAVLLDTAKRTYEAAKAHPAMYAPLESSEGGGAYGDDDVTDEFYWAAAELYLSTGENDYYRDMARSSWYLKIPVSLSGGEANGTFGSFDWGHTSALGTLSLALGEDKMNLSSVSSEIKNAIIEAADLYISTENEQGYGQPYRQSWISWRDNDEGYVWGSNSFVVDNSVIMAYAYILTGDKKYYNGVVSGMDYLLGRNPMDSSYVTGYGSTTSIYPHHRYWAYQIDEKYPMAPCGVLVGGPNSGMEDPWVQGSGWKKGMIAPAKCYMDNIEAWSVNECTINWNAPLAWVTGFLTGYSEDGIIVGSTGNGNGITIAPETEYKERTTEDGKTEDKNTEKQTEKKTTETSAKNDSLDNKKDDTSSGIKGKTDSSDDGSYNNGKDSVKNNSAEKSETSAKTNWLLIIGIILGFILLFTGMILFFVYRMTKLKMNNSNNDNNK
ncbi:MAG: glycoside hydrolase family 9 protein [Eubacterium sp.]|nr:glycoside hydrolase family 9 protein [Eubacterium sp.]